MEGKTMDEWQEDQVIKTTNKEREVFAWDEEDILV